MGLSRRKVLGLLGAALPLAACGTDTRRSTTTLGDPVTLPSFEPPATTAPGAGIRAQASPAAFKTAAAERRGGPVPAVPGKAMLGSYLAHDGMSLKQSLAMRRRQLGREQRIVHRFYPWSGYVPSSEPDVGPDSVLMVSWHGTAWQRINSGAEDANIASVARRLAGMQRPVLLRWGWEMNGNWFPWDGSHNGGNPANYVRAWRRLHRVFAAEGAGNIAWVWSPNWNSAPDTAANRFQKYYPGDAYVDWVGVSGYNFSAESPRTLFSGVVKAYGNRKPVMLSEIAAVGAGRAAWIRQLHSWVSSTPAVGAVVWFDTDIQPGSPHNFRFDTDRAARDAYIAMARSAHFAG